MTIQQIRYVIGVSDAGSFNKASEKLFISQPSLTSSVHDLEYELGFSIFNRTARGITMTERGERFLFDARHFYREGFDFAFRELKQAITAVDRATVLNLLKALNGYTFLSGVIGEETDGDFVPIPLKYLDDDVNRTFELGYITQKGVRMDNISLTFIDSIRRILHIAGFSC